MTSASRSTPTSRTAPRKCSTRSAASWQPTGATAIVMDPNSGAILALANWPRVNANELQKAPDYARMNRAIGALYEPGSTFKAMTVAAALEDGKVTPETKFNLPPTLAIADRELKDAEAHGYETRTTSQILEVSSNIGAVLIARRVGTNAFDSVDPQVGLRQADRRRPAGRAARARAAAQGVLGLHHGQPADRPGHRGDADADGDGATPRSPTAASCARRTSSPPSTVARRRSRPASAWSPRPPRRRCARCSRACSARAAPLPAPRSRATRSRARRARRRRRSTGGYSKDKYVASFVGFAPADKPKLLVSVMVDEPKGEIYGGQVAAPAWREIVNFALSYLKISPN